jgi:hypothetical protein
VKQKALFGVLCFCQRFYYKIIKIIEAKMMHEKMDDKSNPSA